MAENLSITHQENEKTLENNPEYFSLCEIKNKYAFSWELWNQLREYVRWEYPDIDVWSQEKKKLWIQSTVLKSLGDANINTRWITSFQISKESSWPILRHNIIFFYQEWWMASSRSITIRTIVSQKEADDKREKTMEKSPEYLSLYRLKNKYAFSWELWNQLREYIEWEYNDLEIWAQEKKKIWIQETLLDTLKKHGISLRSITDFQISDESLHGEKNHSITFVYQQNGIDYNRTFCIASSVVNLRSYDSLESKREDDEKLRTSLDMNISRLWTTLMWMREVFLNNKEMALFEDLNQNDVFDVNRNMVQWIDWFSPMSYLKWKDIYELQKIAREQINKIEKFEKKHWKRIIGKLDDRLQEYEKMYLSMVMGTGIETYDKTDDSQYDDVDSSDVDMKELVNSMLDRNERVEKWKKSGYGIMKGETNVSYEEGAREFWKTSVEVERLIEKVHIDWKNTAPELLAEMVKLNSQIDRHNFPSEWQVQSYEYYTKTLSLMVLGKLKEIWAEDQYFYEFAQILRWQRWDSDVDYETEEVRKNGTDALLHVLEKEGWVLEKLHEEWTLKLSDKIVWNESYWQVLANYTKNIESKRRVPILDQDEWWKMIIIKYVPVKFVDVIKEKDTIKAENDKRPNERKFCYMSRDDLPKIPEGISSDTKYIDLSLKNKVELGMIARLNKRYEEEGIIKYEDEAKARAKALEGSQKNYYTELDDILNDGAMSVESEQWDKKIVIGRKMVARGGYKKTYLREWSVSSMEIQSFDLYNRIKWHWSYVSDLWKNRAVTWLKIGWLIASSMALTFLTWWALWAVWLTKASAAVMWNAYIGWAVAWAWAWPSSWAFFPEGHDSNEEMWKNRISDLWLSIATGVLGWWMVTKWWTKVMKGWEEIPGWIFASGRNMWIMAADIWPLWMWTELGRSALMKYAYQSADIFEDMQKIKKAQEEKRKKEIEEATQDAEKGLEGYLSGKFTMY